MPKQNKAQIKSAKQPHSINCNQTMLHKYKTPATSIYHGNKTFRRNEAKIQKVLCDKIAQRRFDVRAVELYQEAGISSPTFYLHYNGPGDARNGYEIFLNNKLHSLLPTSAKKIMVFNITTSFIVHNRKYFLATQVSRDYHFLFQCLEFYRFNLVGKSISDKSFHQYVGELMIIIDNWLTFSKINQETAKLTANKLIKVRVKWID